MADIFLPAEQRREILREYGRVYDLDVFVETGTSDGGTPWALKDSFSKLHTIELQPQFWYAATQKFANYPHVECWQGDSSQILPLVLDQFEGPALFWLDGHHSGGISAYGDRSTPIREELDILFQDARPHVILVDDARVFEEGAEHTMYDHYADYPAISWVEQQAYEHGFSFLHEDDIMRLTPVES